MLNQLFTKSFSAAGTAEVPIVPYRIATLLPTGKVGLATTSSSALGVFSLPPYSSIHNDRMIDVCLLGIVHVECGGAINIGDKVKSDANGRAIVAATGESIGIALTAGTTGEICSIFIR